MFLPGGSGADSGLTFPRRGKAVIFICCQGKRSIGPGWWVVRAKLLITALLLHPSNRDSWIQELSEGLEFFFLTFIYFCVVSSQSEGQRWCSQSSSVGAGMLPGITHLLQGHARKRNESVRRRGDPGSLRARHTAIVPPAIRTQAGRLWNGCAAAWFVWKHGARECVQ